MKGCKKCKLGVSLIMIGCCVSGCFGGTSSQENDALEITPSKVVEMKETEQKVQIQTQEEQDMQDLEEMMRERGAMNYCIVEDWIYYVTLGEEEGFHKMSLDGKQDTILCNFSEVSYPISGSTSVRSTVEEGSIAYEFQTLSQRVEEGISEPPHPIGHYRLDLTSGTLERGRVEVSEDVCYVYEVDLDSYEVYPEAAIVLNREESLQKQLQQAMDTLSKNRFDSLPIQVKAIKEESGKTIAVINLEEQNGRTIQEALAMHEKTKAVCWVQDYFQGSAGAILTRGSIQNTVLQPSYTGVWIDGYELLYNEGIEGWGHMEGLGERIYK